MLILHGGRDYQTTMDGLNSWRRGLEGQVNVEFKLYETLNHLFMYGEGPPSSEDYSTASHVDEAVVKDISEWLSDKAERL